MIKNTCDILCEPTADRLIITVSGEIDHHGAVYLRQKADEAIRAYVPQRLVLDMSGVSFMDSSGIGLIMGRHVRMQEVGGKLSVREPNERIVKIFELAGLTRIVSIERDGKKRRGRV